MRSRTVSKSLSRDVSSGNQPRGIVRLSAERERNFVVIVLADDGRGIDVEEIKKTILQRGMATQEELSSLNPKEVMMLVSRPG